ncbi:MAG: ferrochelatase [Saprospiraceae bacterium]|nr:ferrochelatase [Saprospiraceae bacterium]
MTTFGKKGVLLVNLGTPDSPARGDVYRYLQEFLLDPRVVDYPWLPRNLLVRGVIAPFRSGSSSKLYKKLWTEDGSPLKVYGVRVAEDIKSHLGEEYVVELAMRYQNPSIQSALKRLLQQQVAEIIVFPLFPQYASATTGSVHEEVMRCLAKEQAIPNVKLVNSYYDHPEMIALFAENARKFDLASYDHILFSYHGLPQRQLRKADNCNYCLKVENCCQTISTTNQFCYSAQCNATTLAIAAALELDTTQYTTCFQSRLGPDKWAQPYTSKTIEEQAKKGAKRLLVFSPAFVADCLETIIEIGEEYQEEFEEMGGEKVDLVPSLNDNPKWIAALSDLIKAN